MDGYKFRSLISVVNGKSGSYEVRNTRLVMLILLINGPCIVFKHAQPGKVVLSGQKFRVIFG